MSDPHLSQLADIFRLLGDASRLSIVMSCLSSPISVGEIANKTQLSQTLVSHHLRLLRAARLVKSQRQGRQIYYSAADFHVSSMITTMLEHLGEDQPELEE